MLNGVPEKVYVVPDVTVGHVVPNWAPFTINFKLEKYEPFATILTLLTFTPSAEEAVKAYEPTFWLDTPGETVWPPNAVFWPTVMLELASDKALPVAGPDELNWLEIWPCKLLDSWRSEAVTVENPAGEAND